jgi:glucosamine--fructose-6-phosphate aminotransferase (isomerizing)
MIVVRKESPMIIGVPDGNDHGIIISSDISGVVAFGNHKAIFLKNNDIALLSGGEISIFNNHSLVHRDYEMIDTLYKDTSKGSYSHFMEKEIYEQPFSISMTMKDRITQHNNHIVIEELIPHLLKFQNAWRILLVACGSSLHSCLAVRNYYEKIFKGKIIQVENACNMIDRQDFFLSSNDIILFLSQSGETSDTLLCLRQMKSKCPKLLTCALTNMSHSSLARECDLVLYNNIGNEIGVASTKSYTSQILLLVMIALQFCDDVNHVNCMIQEMLQLPALLSTVLATPIPTEVIEAILECNNLLILGRNEHFATALEMALKLKEISYIHSEGMLADELKHGPLAMIDSSVVVLVIASSDMRMNSTIQQLRARNAKMIIIQPHSESKIPELCLSALNPLKNNVLRTIVDIVPCQLLAYRLAIEKQINVDQPRHLAKSVTVSD